ncbi:MAG: helix-turn-helix domain-containing protein [Candidatus Acidiferrum sp.]|jgi:DNA-binding transcriptional MerR regulator
MKEAKDKPEQKEQDGELSLGALAEESGLSERTIRYYISRGLLEGPARGGRGAYYTPEHLKRLREIQRSQQQGLTLTEIERSGDLATVPTRLPEPETWHAYPLAEDIVVQVKAGSSPWRQHQVKSTLERLARELSPKELSPKDGAHKKEEKQ